MKGILLKETGSSDLWAGELLTAGVECVLLEDSGWSIMRPPGTETPEPSLLAQSCLRYSGLRSASPDPDALGTISVPCSFHPVSSPFSSRPNLATRCLGALPVLAGVHSDPSMPFCRGKIQISLFPSQLLGMQHQ